MIAVASKYSAAPRRSVPGWATISGKKAAGEVRTFDKHGRRLQQDCYQCNHCQFTWEKLPGGPKPNVCLHCMGVTCNKKECNTQCVPMMKRLEIVEKWGRRALRRTLQS